MITPDSTIEFLRHMSDDTLCQVYDALAEDRAENIKERRQLNEYCFENEIEPFFMLDEILLAEYDKIDQLMCDVTCIRIYLKGSESNV